MVSQCEIMKRSVQGRKIICRFHDVLKDRLISSNTEKNSPVNYFVTRAGEIWAVSESNSLRIK